jgi:arginine:pyruvate transaminase
VRDTGQSGDGFARRLLEAEDVSVLSGDAFGGPAAGHVRVGLVVPEARLSEACARIARFTRQL